MQKHTMTRKRMDEAPKLSCKKCSFTTVLEDLLIFKCNECYFTTNRKINLEKHTLTHKHLEDCTNF